MNHFAKLSKSDRLQRIKKLLMDRKPHSTRDIIRRAHVASVANAIGELRLNGFPVHCYRSGKNWFYLAVKSDD